MYLPDNCDTLLTLPDGSEAIQCISGNRERTVIAVVTNSTLHFYLSNLKLLACAFRRPADEQEERGDYRRLYWRQNSNSVAVTTSKHFIYVYSVEVAHGEECFSYEEANGEQNFTRQSSELFLKQKRPQINVQLSVVAKLESSPTSVVSLKDELFICLTDGWIHRLSWVGEVLPDLAFNIRSVPLSSDQISSKVEKLSRTTVHVADIAYCPLVGGLCAVLSDGRAVLLVSNNPQSIQPDGVTGFWAQNLKDACCVAPNHKFRMIYFGCRNGDIAGYSIDDTNGALTQIFRIGLTIKNGIECLERISAVRQIQVLPAGAVFAVVWDLKEQAQRPHQHFPSPMHTTTRSSCNNNNGSISDASLVNMSANGDVGDNRSTASYRATFHAKCSPALAIFSPFGAQWWNSLEDSLTSGESSSPSQSYSSIEWGPESLQLWLGLPSNRMAVMGLVRSVPDPLKRVPMVGADRVYLSPNNMHEKTAVAPHVVWESFKVPSDYISVHWPLRHVAMDEECCRLLVTAGQRGFCYYTFKLAKWRLFRKETQESALLVTGGVAVFQDFILVASSNTINDGEYLYAFNSTDQLDLDTAISTPTKRLLLMNLSTHPGNSNSTQRHYLVTFDISATISIYSLKQTNSTGTPAQRGKSPVKLEIDLDCMAEIRIGELLPHPSCVITVQLAKLDYFPDAVEFCAPGLDSLLVNVAGHLLVLSPVQSNNTSSSDDGDTQGEERNFQLHPPSLIASNVERVWQHPAVDASSLQQHCNIPYVSKALWVNCGSKRVKIWLPLSKESAENSSRSFISRRIMLPLDLGFYPLGMFQKALDGDCLVCGAECFSMKIQSADYFNAADSSSNELGSDWEEVKASVASQLDSHISVHSLSRLSEVFIHRLLKQLLKRNLGSYALAIASACSSLPYFSHMLELLLHEVLDEEATSSEPIPDPMLPTVVSFIHEFPSHYLQTIIHCARKTELAFWNLLFSVSHPPRQLFKMCLEEGQLETATSCLILLQSVEPAHTSAQFATILLEEALTKHRWTAAMDIVRFIRSIDGNDFEGTPESPLYQKLARTAGKQKHGLKHQMSEGGGEDSEAFGPMFANGRKESMATGGVGRAGGAVTRQHSMGIAHSPPHPLTIHTPHAKTGQLSAAPPTASKKSISPLGQTPKQTSHPSMKLPHFQHLHSINSILNNHASVLVADFALRDLAAFASHLEFDLISFFARPENAFAVGEDEFPLALMKLHAQFGWPYPFPNSELKFITLPVDGNTHHNHARKGGLSPASREEDTVSTKSSDACASSKNGLAGTDSAELARRVFEKLCLSPRVIGTKESEAELNFLLTWLSKTDALEWIYMLCIMRQDATTFREKLLSELHNEKRIESFIDRVKGGTVRLHEWAEAKCEPYLHCVRTFKEFVEG